MCTNNNSPEFNLMVGDVERFLKHYKEDPYYINNGTMPRWSFDPWDLRECNENAIYAEFLVKTNLHCFTVLANRWTEIFNKVTNKTKANLREATDQVIKEMNEWFALVTWTSPPQVAHKKLTKNGIEVDCFPLHMIKANFLKYDIICYDWKKLEAYKEIKHQAKTHLKKNDKDPMITKKNQAPYKKKKKKKTFKLQSMTLWDLWINNKNFKSFERIIMNPMPIELDPEIRNQYNLNLWSGFATGFGRDDVLQCTDFKLIAPFLNHLRYVWYIYIKFIFYNITNLIYIYI